MDVNIENTLQIKSQFDSNRVDRRLKYALKPDPPKKVKKKRSEASLQKKRDNARKRYANLSQEEHENYLETKRKYRENLSEDKRQRKLSLDRLRIANLTREQHQKRLMAQRKYKLTRTEEQHNETLRRRRENRVLSRVRCIQENFQTEESEHPIIGKEDPLTKIVRIILDKKQRLSHHAYHTIDRIRRSVFRQILRKFQIKFAHEFFVDCLIEIFKSWYRDDDAYNSTEIDLSHFICASLDYVKNNYFENILNVTCSFRQLKCLFSNNSKSIAAMPESPYNWPYISLRIDLPGFAMMRCNCNADEFVITNNVNCMDYFKQDTTLQFESDRSTAAHSSKSILKFLNRLKLLVINHELIRLADAIAEFESDVDLCDKFIETSTQYSVNSIDYPYVRCASDKSKLSAIPICLYQYTYPKIMFKLEQFDVDDEPDFGSQTLYECITCVCNLCNESLGSILSDGLSKHVTEFHGYENDWSCVKCNQSFSTDYLSKHRWRHECHF